jgi:hypothetical protein
MTDLLVSWNDGVAKRSILDFVMKTKFEWRDGKSIIMRLPELYFFDDKPGKPADIQHYIGRRPIAAFGNSDGDLQMLQWTSAVTEQHLGLIVHHTDGEREFAYDKSSMGSLDQALTDAKQEGWVVVDMKQDWKRIFAFEP